MGETKKLTNSPNSVNQGGSSKVDAKSESKPVSTATPGMADVLERIVTQNAGLRNSVMAEVFPDLRERFSQPGAKRKALVANGYDDVFLPIAGSESNDQIIEREFVASEFFQTYKEKAASQTSGEYDISADIKNPYNQSTWYFAHNAILAVEQTVGDRPLRRSARRDAGTVSRFSHMDVGKNSPSWSEYVMLSDAPVTFRSISPNGKWALFDTPDPSPDDFFALFAGVPNGGSIPSPEINFRLYDLGSASSSGKNLSLPLAASKFSFSRDQTRLLSSELIRPKVTIYQVDVNSIDPIVKTTDLGAIWHPSYNEVLNGPRFSPDGHWLYQRRIADDRIVDFFDLHRNAEHWSVNASVLNKGMQLLFSRSEDAVVFADEGTGSGVLFDLKLPAERREGVTINSLTHRAGLAPDGIYTHKLHSEEVSGCFYGADYRQSDQGKIRRNDGILLDGTMVKIDSV